MSKTVKQFLSGAVAGLILIGGLLVIGLNPVTSNDQMSDTEDGTIVDIAAGNDQFSTLTKAVKAAGLVETLNKEGPYTLFAPTNNAFDQLSDGKLQKLLQSENRDKLRSILSYHVIPGRITYGDVMGIEGVHSTGGSMVETLSGKQVNINVVGETVKVNGATVVEANIEASNGIVHVINGVLTPTSKPTSMSSQKAMRQMRDAIERGAPMYNRGHHGRTAKLYMKTSMRILNQPGDDLPEEALDALRHSTGLARRMHDESERAWVLRYGMDAALRTMNETKRKM
jgi:uncharacterized surface protein with fasciclin (FAS1) repeats